jgi:hypothetical protein
MKGFFSWTQQIDTEVKKLTSLNVYVLLQIFTSLHTVTAQNPPI